MIQAAALYATVGVSGAGQSVRELGAVTAAADKTMAKFSVLGLKSQGFGKGIRQVAGGVVKLGEVAAAGFVVATAASAHFATEFQSNMELIHTQAGDTQDAVDKLTVGVQNLVHEVGTNPVDLAKGLYHIESVGVRGAASLDILKASAIGAKVGLADMESVTNALTGVWFSGIKAGKDMTDTMAILDGIVGVGNMHLQDLTDSFKSGILGTAATFGVDIRSLGAAIATLTDAGVPANIAATRLNMTLSHMAAPVPKAIDTLKKLGIGQFDLANDLRKPDGIFVALKDLHDHLAAAGDIGKDGKLTPQGADAMTKIFGGSRFGATAMQLLTAMDRVDQKYVAITQRSDTFAGNVKKTMETASFHWGQFIADVENDAISFGQGVLPGLIHGLDKLDAFVVSHRQDAVKLGVEVGDAITRISDAIERIDWSRFNAGLDAAKSVAQLALDVLKQVPPEMAVAFAGLVGIDKLSGGLLGKGGGNIIGAGLNQFFGRGSAANPMWVRNVGGIPGVGGEGVNLGEVAATTIAGVSVGTIGLIAAAAAASTFAFVNTYNGPKAMAPGSFTPTITSAFDNRPSDASSLSNVDWRGVVDGLRNGTETASQLRDAAHGFDTTAAENSEAASQLRNAAYGLSGAAGALSDAADRTNAEIYGLSAKARGFTYDPSKPASKTLAPRFEFLAAHHKGSKDVAVADALVRHFQTGSSPLYTSDKNLRAAIRAVEHDITQVGPKTAKSLRHDLDALKTELARRTSAAGAKAATAATLAGQATTQAIKDKDLSVSVESTPVELNLDGKRLTKGLIRYGVQISGPTRFG